MALPTAQGMSSASAGIQAGTQALSGVVSYLESKRQAKIVETQAKIEKKQISKRERWAKSDFITGRAGKGVKFDDGSLRRMGDIIGQYEEQKIIVGESARLQKDAIETKGKMALIQGLTGAVTSAADAFSSPDIGLSDPTADINAMGVGKPLPTDYSDIGLTRRKSQEPMVKPTMYDSLPSLDLESNMFSSFFM